MKISPSNKITGIISVPPDKSISHRAFIISGIAKTQSTIRNILESDDVKTSLTTMQKLGVGFSGDFGKMTISPFTKPKSSQLYCGNSGTTTRLVSGVVSAYEGVYDFSGDESLTARPMERISTPLSRMGSVFAWKGKKGYLPYSIKGGTLEGIRYENMKRSAQVKSAILLAGLKAKGPTTVYETIKTRDHTERLLSQMGAEINFNDETIELNPSEINGLVMTIPGDFSSASFFLTLSACHQNASIAIQKCSTNSSRTALLEIMRLMGADVVVNNQHDDLEPYADIHVKSSDLTGIQIPDHYIPNMIDELPLVAILACHAKGKTVVRNASELRVKETDRIAILCEILRNLGVSIKEYEDGFEVEGPQTIRGGIADSHNDHRMAMLGGICGILSQEGVKIERAECCSVSFPNFFEKLKEITL